MIYYFLGASNPETIRMIKAIQRQDIFFDVGGFIDNDEEKKGSAFYGYPVIGGFEVLPSLISDDARFVNLITRSAILRYQTSKVITDKGGKLANFIHPSVDLTMVKIGTGNYIQEGVIVQAGVEIGDNCSIHMGTLIGHESVIHDHTFIAHGVSVSGCCEIGKGCFIGTHATIFPRITIGNWSTVGAGSVVRKRIDQLSVVSGNPAKLIKKNTEPQ